MKKKMCLLCVKAEKKSFSEKILKEKILWPEHKSAKQKGLFSICLLTYANLELTFHMACTSKFNCDAKQQT